MVREILLQPKLETDLVYKALLIAIEENLIDEVSCLLERSVERSSERSISRKNTPKTRAESLSFLQPVSSTRRAGTAG